MNNFSTIETEDFSSYLTETQFWKGIGVWVRSPHVENRRLCGVKTLVSGLVLEPEDARQVVNRLIKFANLSPVILAENVQASSILEATGIKLQNLDTDTDAPSDHTIVLKVRQFLPKNTTLFQPCLEAVVLDGWNTQAIFIHLGPADDTLSPRTPYCCRLKQSSDCDAATIEFLVCQEQGVSEVTENSWLRTKLFPRLVKWIALEHNPSATIPEGSLGLVDLNEYNEKYQQLKKKYGPQMVEIWPEQTDPLKFVYEDLAIASYLLCLWGCKEGEKKDSFVDLGCGNGLLVHILSSEGHPGLGLDVRSRKLWALYPSSTRLQVQSVIPSPDTTFPDYDWIIGNHSDELTPWIPVMAALSSPKTSFFVLPCCPFDFWGKYQRINPANSQYEEYISFVKSVGETCGFKTEIDKLRIPSTKRTCLIGRQRLQQMDKNMLWDYVNSRKQGGQVDFSPRPAREPVRNCTKLAQGVAARVVELITSHLMRGINKEESQWQLGGDLTLPDAAALLTSALRAGMKSECGGLQTLLRNHHNIFLVQGGVVKFRRPKSSVCTDPKRWKNKPCWFFSHHPQGCPLEEQQCSYDHTLAQ